MNKALLAAGLLLVAVALLGGVWAVGGPVAARLQRQDDQRWQDLSQLHRYLTCRPRDRSTQPLPEALDSADYCPSFQLLGRDGRSPFTDPVTGAPYTYRRLSDSRFEVCATFAGDPAARRDAYARRLEWEAGNLGCLRGDSRYRG